MFFFRKLNFHDRTFLVVAASKEYRVAKRYDDASIDKNYIVNKSIFIFEKSKLVEVGTHSSYINGVLK